MRMLRPLVIAVFLLLLTTSAVLAQSAIAGVVKDSSGGVLPGVTVTATSPELLAPVIAVSDTAGYYRLNNLPPGTYTYFCRVHPFMRGAFRVLPRR